VLQTFRIAAQLGRQSPDRKDPVRECESRLVGLLVDVILDGVYSGDLYLRTAQRPEQLAFTTWILAFGARSWMDTSVATDQLGTDDGKRVARDATEMLLDALGWQPLSRDWDYQRTRERIRRELFGREWAQVAAATARRDRTQATA